MDRRAFLKTLTAAGIAATAYPAISGVLPYDEQPVQSAFYDWKHLRAGITISGDRSDIVGMFERKIEAAERDMLAYLDQHLYG